MRANRTFAVALAQLQAACAPSAEPVLTDADLTAILNDNALASVWTPNTVFQFGDRIVPTIPNGRVYTISQNADGTYGGTSGSVEPSPWTIFGNWPGPGEAYQNDGTLRWRDDDREVGLWDVRAAIYDAWMMKAGRASEKISTGSDRAIFAQQQIYDHCTDMARTYAPYGIS